MSATETRPDLVLTVARSLGRAASALGRFTVETVAGWGLRTALPAPRAEAQATAPRSQERDEALRLPWSDGHEFPSALADFGVLLEVLRVAPGDSVVEIGTGGAGWRSHFLNLLGCPTVTIDLDPGALDTTRVLFRRHPGTRWDLDPRFVSSDGRRLPLPDGSCSRVFLPTGPPDAPPAEVLAELCRITETGGRVVCNLPARRGTAGLESFAREAQRAGFTATTVVPVARGAAEVPAMRLRRLLRGRGLLAFWHNFTASLLAAHVVVLSKGVFVPTTRRPGKLAGRLEVAPRREGDEPLWLEAAAGTVAQLHCRLHNLGDTLWLGGEPTANAPGTTRLTLRLGHAQAPVERMVPWHQLALPRDVGPGEVLEVEIELPELPEPGDYRLGLGLEAVGLGAFGPECPGIELRLQVR